MSQDGPLIPGGLAITPAQRITPSVPGRWFPGTMLTPGSKGFNRQISSMMVARKLYIGRGGDLRLDCEGDDLANVRVASWLAGPETPINRLLVIHRTGSGKTHTMVRIAEAYFHDPRPKIIIFPNNELVNNFYGKLFKMKTAYADFVQAKAAREHKAYTLSYLQEKLGMEGELSRMGKPGELMAPIRPIRYSIAGGSTVLGSNGPQLPIFRIMYSGGNPFDNKIILMDEVHNLVSPPEGTDKRLLKKLERMRNALFTAKNSVIVGLTATPIIKDVKDGEELLRVIKGKEYENAPTNEGFVSYFNCLPTTIYPRPIPNAQAVTVVRVPLKHENAKKYIEKLRSREFSKDPNSVRGQIFGLMGYCNFAGYYAQSSRGELANNLRRHPERFACKLHVIADDMVSYPNKCAILIHRKLGFEALRQVIMGKDPRNERRFAFMGKPKSLKEQRDNPILRAFNDNKTNGRGERIRCLVLDAETYGEGIDLIGVRKFVMAHPPTDYAAYNQWTGRVFRACAYAYLPHKERDVTLEMYVAKLPDGEPTADEVMLSVLRNETAKFEVAMRDLFALPASDRYALGHP